VTIHGYIGDSERFAESIADFAEAYADQTERDHAALVAAIERGVVPAAAI
jgi:adenine/guanine phosphoribosyltransferase-like PRPP-binding protein